LTVAAVDTVPQDRTKVGVVITLGFVKLSVSGAKEVATTVVWVHEFCTRELTLYLAGVAAHLRFLNTCYAIEVRHVAGTFLKQGAAVRLTHVELSAVFRVCNCGDAAMTR